MRTVEPTMLDVMLLDWWMALKPLLAAAAQPVAHVPLPSSAMMGLILLGGLAMFGRGRSSKSRRRRRQRDFDDVL